MLLHSTSYKTWHEGWVGGEVGGGGGGMLWNAETCSGFHGSEPWGLKHTHEKLGTDGRTICKGPWRNYMHGCEDFAESESGNFLDQLNGHPFLNENPQTRCKTWQLSEQYQRNRFPLNRFVSLSERTSALRQLIWTKMTAKLKLPPSKINSEQCNEWNAHNRRGDWIISVANWHT